MSETPGRYPAMREVLSVSRLNEAARAVLESEFGNVWVQGEVSNLARPASGHVYFSLKDDGAQIRCAMFRRRGQAVDFQARDGESVIAFGRISLYTARGDYQLIVEAVEAAGEGLLRLRFEQLKRKLLEEGLFDPARKRPLPRWPGTIGIVTSTTGAAVRDVLTVLRRRCPALRIIVYPTAVQGEGAAAEIAAAIARANRRAECAVLIVGRGGGSLEDLWAFNEELVARAIHASLIPVVSAVGHEVDFTIADLVADVRAPTPSAAAELVSPDMADIDTRLGQFQQRLARAAQLALRNRLRELQQLERRLISPRRRLEQHFQRLDELLVRLPAAVNTQLRLQRSRLQALTAGVATHSPRTRVAALQRELEHRRHRLASGMRRTLEQRAASLARCESVLRALGPVATLERGYAIVTDSRGDIVRNAAQLLPSQELETRLAQGQFTSSVLERKPAPEQTAE